MVVPVVIPINLGKAKIPAIQGHILRFQVTKTPDRPASDNVPGNRGFGMLRTSMMMEAHGRFLGTGEKSTGRVNWVGNAEHVFMAVNDIQVTESHNTHTRNVVNISPG